MTKKPTLSEQVKTPADKAQKLLGRFSEAVDRMKHAYSKNDKMMFVWADDLYAVEAVMSFLESIRDGDQAMTENTSVTAQHGSLDDKMRDLGLNRFRASQQGEPVAPEPGWLKPALDKAHEQAKQMPGWMTRHDAPAPQPVREGELTADFTKSLPGGTLDDSTFSQIEDALDAIDAPMMDGDRYMTLVERIAALASQQGGEKAEASAQDAEGCHCERCEFFQMLWDWFADESRHGSEEMRANQANGGLSSDDFKNMLDEHESALLADVALHQPAVQSPAVAAQEVTGNNDLHFLAAIKVRLSQLYVEHPHDCRLREQISDEVDWIDEQLGRRSTPTAETASSEALDPLAMLLDAAIFIADQKPAWAAAARKAVAASRSPAAIATERAKRLALKQRAHTIG